MAFVRTAPWPAGPVHARLIDGRAAARLPHRHRLKDGVVYGRIEAKEADPAELMRMAIPSFATKRCLTGTAYVPSA
jgi:hypothetical protein